MPTGSSYLKKRRTALKFLTRTPKRKFGQRQFHQLRVEIKKLRATLIRLEFQLKNFDGKRIYKPFRKLFAQAGKVREIQIEKAMLHEQEEQGQLPEYLKQLDKKIRKERSRFFNVRNVKLNSKIQKRLKSLEKKNRDAENLDPAPFLNSLTDEIKLLLLTGSLAPEGVHLLRKKLKNLTYNLESLPHQKLIQAHPDQDHLVNLLGTWHDLITVHQTLLTEITSEKISQEEKPILEKINDKFKSESDRIFDEINQKIPLFDDFVFFPKPKSQEN